MNVAVMKLDQPAKNMTVKRDTHAKMVRVM